MKNESNLKSSLSLAGIVLLGFLNFFGNCTGDRPPKYLNGFFPETPVNFSELNTVYDDYNSSPPLTIDGQFDLYFSSNRNKSGKDFDIIGAMVFYGFDNSTGNTNMRANVYYYPQFQSQLSHINSFSNELGPNFDYHVDGTNYLFYSSDLTGKQQIYCLENESYSDYGPFPVNALNSMVSNEGYVTIDSLNHTIYFMSDRDGTYDIFKRVFPTTTTFKNWLTTTSSSLVEKVSELSTTSDDKCPYINGRLMVFASNREGGYGGFDLWYSVLDNGTWSQPVNFGPKINSKADDYRPVVMTDNYFGNDLMVFSSNREGGKGGYDLYYVGIPKMTK